MKKIQLIGWLLLMGATVSILSGCCLTAQVGDKIHKKSSPYHEFKAVQTDCSSLTVHAGAYVGDTQLNWTAYHVYQFDGLLKGDDRVLEILIPVENIEKKKMAILREQPQGTEIKAPAYLFIKDRNVVADCKEEPLGLFEEAFQQQYKHHGLILHDDPYRELHYTIPSNEESDKRQWVSILTDSDLKWLNRDEEEVRWLRWRYLYAVPLDIVLFPFCLLGFIPTTG